MSRIFSLAAAGALLLTTASAASAEGFDVRAQLLHNKFGDSLNSHIARRQESDFNSNEPLDDLSSTITSASASGLATASALTDSTSSPSWTTTFTPSGTSASSRVTATSTSFGDYDDDSYTGYFSGPDADYIVDMCMPNMFDTSRARALGINLYVSSMSQAYLEAAKLVISLGGSPFPCEQSIYIEYACHANATTPVDYLAEQQCYCGSSFWDADQACNDCLLAHGLLGPSKQEYGARMQSFSSKVCAATLAPGGIGAAASTDLPEQTAILSYASKSAVANPSKTAVSYYATVKGMTVPAITGEATARATTWEDWKPVSGSGASGNAAAPMVGIILSAMALGAGMML